ncbi:hypothetical protein ACFL3S_01580 [Gemmatimonadota bacterium]
MSKSGLIQQHLRTLSILSAAIVSGIVLFGAVVFYLLSSGGLGQGSDVPGSTGLILYLSALSVLVVAHFLPKALETPGRGASLEEVLAWHKKTTLIAMGLREGAAFMALVGIMLTGSWTPGIGVAGLAILTIVLGWPRETQIQGYMRDPGV